MVGDFAYRPPADGGDARNRQQIGDECVRAFGVGADERREHALIFRPGICRADREPIEILRQRCLMVETLDRPPLPWGARSSTATRAQNRATSPMRMFGAARP